MSANTKIEWADHTFNPWEGCQKVGPGCDNCYAEARNARFGGGTAVNWGPDAPRRRTSVSNWRQPLAWDKAHATFHATHGRRQRVFCASLADVFDNAVPVAWRIELLYLIHRTPNLDWMLLTKRIGNARFMLEEAARNLVGGPPTWWNAEAWTNVWIGATIVNQEEADRDIAKLLQVNAAVRFLSMEPLLGPVDLTPKAGPIYQRLSEWYGPNGFDETGSQPRQLRRAGYFPRLDWVIAGGESGPGARPSHPDWYRSLRDQCAAAGVPFLFKQWGEFAETRTTAREFMAPILAQEGEQVVESDGTFGCAPNADNISVMRRVGKKAAGRQLDGVTHDSFPEGWSA